MDINLLTSFARYVLTFELLLGGQARLTNLFTPRLTEKAYAKAEGYHRYLPIVPGRTAKEHSQVIGGLMALSGILLTLPKQANWEGLRYVGKGLALVLPLMGVYSQARMGVPYWLPCVNAILASVIIYGESL